MNLEQIIQNHVASLELSERALLKDASLNLSRRYRTASYGEKPLTKLERYAYLLARLPATYAATLEVFRELSARFINFSPSSVADIGAGPGTASWAALSLWPSLVNFQFIEKDAQWIKLGKVLAQKHESFKQARWMEHDLLRDVPLQSADIIVAAYSFQEIADDRLSILCEELFAKTLQAMVIIEPGTPRSFKRVKKLRTLLIEKGAHIIAPCTHDLSCPMMENDWCHFKTRLKRGQAHRHLKDGSLAFEDEKYAYLIAAPKPPEITGTARIIRAPIKRAGHIILDLCKNSGLEREVIARSDKARFRKTKKLGWGANIEHDELDRE